MEKNQMIWNAGIMVLAAFFGAVASKFFDEFWDTKNIKKSSLMLFLTVLISLILIILVIWVITLILTI